MTPVIMESPLRAGTIQGFERNLRYALWCARHLTLLRGYAVYASHLICPLFMDDRVANERERGLRSGLDIATMLLGKSTCDNGPIVGRVFCIDCGMSEGMQRAWDLTSSLWRWTFSLREQNSEYWAQFEENLAPPSTPGFALLGSALQRSACGCPPYWNAIADREPGPRPHHPRCPEHPSNIARRAANAIPAEKDQK